VQPSLLNNAGITATLAALVYMDASDAKCQQGHGVITTLIQEAKGRNKNQQLQAY
jgi:hypothetical protein